MILCYGGFFRYVALKQVALSTSEKSQREVEALEREIELLKTMSHPNIVQYYGTKRSGNKLYVLPLPPYSLLAF